ncbi:MAG: DUF1648 domain-containing protein [Clostridia bacterium]|nr:DUF1648 domain-containing protein [Clostridia bacterium]
MKFMKWKTLIITCAVCILPILLGVALWDKLPETMAIHFNMYNQPDNFASKGFVVFGLPVMMVILQIICCVINDIMIKQYGERKKFTTVTKWIIPIMAIILQVVTLLYGLGMMIDIRRVAMLIVAGIFIVMGNYMPKFDYINNYDVEAYKARKINRFIGILMVIMGILAVISIFLPPVYSVVWLFLLIPYAVFCIVYGIKVGRKNEKND